MVVAASSRYAGSAGGEIGASCVTDDNRVVLKLSSNTGSNGIVGVVPVRGIRGCGALIVACGGAFHGVMRSA